MTGVDGPSEPVRGRALDPQELAVLLERHMDVLRTYVRLRAGALLRSRETVDDVVQSAVRELYEHRAALVYEGDAAFRGYLCTLVTHKIISKSRRYDAQMRSPEREQALSDSLWDLPQPGGSRPSRSPSRHAEHSDELARLQVAFDALDEQDRQILAMRKVFEMPTREIAAVLGMAESTVRWRIGAILSDLASRFE
jgi:RNA polymerase sigma factor (sigma-70 family)